jgi:uncharacterized membrane protein (DUF485 family)
LDEVLMVASTVGDIIRIARYQEFIQKHKALSIIILIALLCLIIFIIGYLISSALK